LSAYVKHIHHQKQQTNTIHCTHLQIIQQWHHIRINTREITIRCAEVGLLVLGQTDLSNQSITCSSINATV